MIVSLWPSFQFVIEDKVMKEYYEKYLRDNTTTVKQGRWVKQPLDFDLCGIVYYQCSECRKEQQIPSNYCPFCGALMDKGE